MGPLKPLTAGNIQTQYMNLTFTGSAILHILFLFLSITIPVKEEVKPEAIKLTIMDLKPIEKPKQVVQQIAEKQPVVKQKDPGTQKVVHKAKELGDKFAKKVQKVQKGDPASRKMEKYVAGQQPRKLPRPNVGSGAHGLEGTNNGGGSGDTYKGLDFGIKSNSNFAPLGARMKIKGGIDDGGAGAGKGGGLGDGIGLSAGTGGLTGTPSGTLEKAKIMNNAGSLTGAANGIIGTSKGAEGLARKGTMALAGIPDETVVLGSIDPDTIRRILLDHLSQFRYCYQSELEGSDAGKDMSGVLSLNFDIGTRGTVQRTNVGGDNKITTKVRSCVAGVLRGIQFPAPMGGGVVEVKQPMNFYPKTI